MSGLTNPTGSTCPPSQLKLYTHFIQSAPVQRLLSGGRAGEREREARWAAEVAAAAGGEAGAAGVGGPGAGPPRAPELAVLAAITAVKKLCCHPDLVSGGGGIFCCRPVCVRNAHGTHHVLVHGGVWCLRS